MFNSLKKLISGIIEIARGMFTVSKHVFRKPITLEYPEKRPELNARYRGKVALLTNEDGSLRCTGCEMCKKVCPCVDLIQINKSKDEAGKIIIEGFTVDIGRCIFCGNCEKVCPSKSIVLTKEFETAEYSREACVLNKEKLTLSPEKSKEIDKEKEENA